MTKPVLNSAHWNFASLPSRCTSFSKSVKQPTLAHWISLTGNRNFMLLFIPALGYGAIALTAVETAPECDDLQFAQEMIVGHSVFVDEYPSLMRCILFSGFQQIDKRIRDWYDSGFVILHRKAYVFLSSNVVSLLVEINIRPCRICDFFISCCRTEEKFVSSGLPKT